MALAVISVARLLGSAALLASVSCGGARAGSPSAALGGAAIVQIAGGRLHACLLRADRTVWCWGNNLEGELGNGGGSSKPRPVPVVDLKAARRIATGSDHTCAVLEDGSASCWGDDTYGQHGDVDSPPEHHRRPFSVPELPSVRDIAAGDAYTCFLLNGGEVRCRGGWIPTRHRYRYDAVTRESSEVLRDHDTLPPYAISGADVEMTTGAVALAGSRDHFCALLADETVQCWSFLQHEEPGPFFERTPLLSPEIRGVTKIAVGREHACALLKGGAVECWGKNDHGQLGTGDRKPSARPVRVRDLPPARAVAAGGCESCALFDDGSVRCWGEPSCAREISDEAVDIAPRRVREVDEVAQVLPGSAALWLTEEGAVLYGSRLHGKPLLLFQATDLGAASRAGKADNSISIPTDQRRLLHR